MKAEDKNESKSKRDNDLVELSSASIAFSSVGIALFLTSIALFSACIALDMVYVSIVLR